MRNSLGAKLTLWNLLFITIALATFGVIQGAQATRAAERALDDTLIDRARDMTRFRPPGQPPGGPGFGTGNGQLPIERNGGGPNGGTPNGLAGQSELGQGGPDRGPNGGPNRDGPPSLFRRPAFLNPTNGPTPNGPTELWDSAMAHQAKTGRIVRGYVEKSGVRLRVISMPFVRPNGDGDVIQVVQEAETVDVARRAQLSAFWMAAPFAILASLGLSLALSKLVISPLRRVTGWAERLANDPQAKDRIAATSSDEIGRLSSAVNQMADGLQGANAALESSLERQIRFTSDAAHELRTPLTSLSLAAENGLFEGATEADMRRSLEVVKRSAGSMGRMTELLLTLARLDANQSRLSTEPLDVEPVVYDAITQAGLDADPRLTFTGFLPALRLRANRDALLQILVNLLTNAATHTPPDGTIAILAEPNGLRVVNSGEGIAPESVERLFERFYRADASRARSQGGYGLGLSISQALAEAQGAQIRVESQLGHGATFFVEFSNETQSSLKPHSKSEE